jgi:hypothetical protein
MSKINLTKMKMYQVGLRYILIAFTGAFLLGACEDENGTDADDLAVPLSVTGANIKAPGRGQYRLQAKLVEGNVTIKTDLSSFASVSSLTISKTINRAPDTSFGTNGVLTVSPGAVSSYDFNYQLQDMDVDQLVGLTFRVETGSGEVVESDLTLNVTLTPRENLSRRKWLWTDKIWVDGGNLRDFKDCENDNYYLFNADGTMSLNFGTKTAVGGSGCDYDGLNVYDSWSLSDDEKEFTITYHFFLTPDNPTTETYRVKTLTTEKLELEIEYDLTGFGLGPEETYMFQFTALPK